jgi:hypothetical protein
LRNLPERDSIERLSLEWKNDILSDSSPIEEPRLLKDKSHSAAIDRDFSRRMFIESCDQIQDRRFPAPGWAQNRRKGVIWDLEGNIFKDRQAPAACE